MKPDTVRFLRYEVITTILWFALDCSWLFEWLLAANILSALVILGALLAAYYSSLKDLVIAIGILLWVSMNAFWVTGDMNELPWALVAAKICAGGVLVCLVVTLWMSCGAVVKFRRVRLGDKS